MQLVWQNRVLWFVNCCMLSILMPNACERHSHERNGGTSRVLLTWLIQPAQRDWILEVGAGWFEGWGAWWGWVGVPESWSILSCRWQSWRTLLITQKPVLTTKQTANHTHKQNSTGRTHLGNKCSDRCTDLRKCFNEWELLHLIVYYKSPYGMIHNPSIWGLHTL